MLNHTRKLQGRLRQKGIATMLTAMILVMLIPVVGLAIDGGMAYIVMTRLSAAADSSALAAARGLNGGATVAAAQAQATTLATNFFNGNFPPGYLNTDSTGANRTVSAAFTLGTGSVANGGNGVPNGVLQVQVTASVKASTYFMRWLGYSNLPISTTGTATRRLLVMTLVLDKSSSMGTRDSAVGSTPTSISNSSSSCEAMVYSSIQFLNAFSPYDYIGVVPFDYTAYSTYAPTTTWGSTSGAAQQIANIQCGNNTNTTAALNLAYNQIKSVNLPLANNVIVLFTDGVPNAVNASFPVRTQVDTRVATSCGTDAGGNSIAECSVPVCTTTAANVRGVIAQWNAFSPTAMSFGGPFKMIDSDPSPVVPAACPQSGTDFAQKTVAYIPTTDYFGNKTAGPWDGNGSATIPGVSTGLAPAGAWIYQVNSHTAPTGTPITSGNSATKNMGDLWSNHTSIGLGEPYNTFQSGPYVGQFRPDLTNTIGVVSMNTAANQAATIRGDTSYRITIHTIYLQGNGGDPVDKAFLQMVSNQPTIQPLIYECSSYDPSGACPGVSTPYPANPTYNSTQQRGLWLATTSATALNNLFAQVASSLLRISQ